MPRLLAAFLICAAVLPAAASTAVAPALTAAQIVDKNVAARGGLDAWRKVQTMVWIGHIVTANAPASQVRFAMEFKRPERTRFEVEARGQISARIYDGASGWKIVQAPGEPPQMQGFTADDVKFARDAGGIGGPLIDYAAKGVAISLEGMDQIEGHQAYRLALKLPSGNVQHVWIDAENFLELRYDRDTRNAVGMVGRLTVSYRDYRDVDGLKLPMTIESGIGSAKETDRMIIDRVVVDSPLEDNLFAKPNLPERRRAAFGQHSARRQQAGAAPMTQPAAAAGGVGGR